MVFGRLALGRAAPRQLPRQPLADSEARGLPADAWRGSAASHGTRVQEAPRKGFCRAAGDCGGVKGGSGDKPLEIIWGPSQSLLSAMILGG